MSAVKLKVAERPNYLFEQEYLGDAVPGPGNYNPRVYLYS